MFIPSEIRNNVVICRCSFCRFCDSAAMKAFLYTIFVYSHGTKQCQHKVAPVCHYIQHASIAEPKEVGWYTS